MNTKGNRNGIILIAVIMAVVETALFLVVKITALSVTAYVFSLIGNVMFSAGKLYVIDSPKTYPWFAAFPMRIWQYLISELALSVIFVAVENLGGWSLPVPYFILLHIILLAVCLMTLMMLNAGREMINQRSEEVRQKVSASRFVQTDVEALIRKFPEYEKSLRQVADALHFSDPMSHSSLAVYEEQIQRGIMAMYNLEESDRIPDQCAELLLQIADRNAKARMMK